MAAPKMQKKDDLDEIITKLPAGRWQEDLINDLEERCGPFFFYTAQAILESKFDNFEYEGSDAMFQGTAFVVADRKLTKPEMQRLAVEIAEEEKDHFTDLDAEAAAQDEEDEKTAAKEEATTTTEEAATKQAATATKEDEGGGMKTYEVTARWAETKTRSCSKTVTVEADSEAAAEQLAVEEFVHVDADQGDWDFGDESEPQYTVEEE